MAKKKENRIQTFTSGLSLRAILFNPVSLVIAVTIMTIWGTILLWKEHQRDIVGLEDYSLKAEKIRFARLTETESAKLREFVMAAEEEKDGLTLLDPALVSRTAWRLKQVGWVESLKQIKKSRSGLEIEVQLRSPVGLIELNRNTAPRGGADKTDRLIPVDRLGFVLPDEAAVEKKLLRFTVFEPKLASDQDRDGFLAVDDDRLRGCAAIASSLGNQWDKFGFHRITTIRPASPTGNPNIPFEIWTNTRSVATKIIWGNPPGQELPGEASVKVKLQVLEKLYAEHGPLNELPSTTIDIRSGTANSSRDKTAEAALEDLTIQ
jgi:hypothetical protein